METAHHLLVECRYTRRVWAKIANWLGLPELTPSAWPSSSSPIEWWATTTSQPNIPRKVARSLALLVTWEVWKERKNRVFDRTESTTASLVIKIKFEFGLWLSAGAKCLANLSV
jgi:hypothetical protein